MLEINSIIQFPSTENWEIWMLNKFRSRVCLFASDFLRVASLSYKTRHTLLNKVDPRINKIWLCFVNVGAKNSLVFFHPTANKHRSTFVVWGEESKLKWQTSSVCLDEEKKSEVIYVQELRRNGAFGENKFQCVFRQWIWPLNFRHAFYVRSKRAFKNNWSWFFDLWCLFQCALNCKRRFGRFITHFSAK